MRLVTIAACAGLAGCGMLPERDVQRVPVRVEVSIPVPCIDEDEIPNEVEPASERLTRDSSPGDKVTEVLVELQQVRAAEGELRALVEGCVTVPGE